MANWVEVNVEAVPEYVEPVMELLRRYGDGEVVVQLEGDWDPDNHPDSDSPPNRVTVTTYLEADPTVDSRKQMIDVGIRLIAHLDPRVALWDRVVEQREWETAWKAHFSLLRVGKRTVLKPSWQDYSPATDEVVIELDPGMAFGTGHHPTTRMCLEALEEHVTPGTHLLDVGTGSGVLAIAAAKLGAQRVVGIDTEDTAVRVAGENASRNGVGQQVSLYGGSVPNPHAPRDSFNIVVANITAHTIATLSPHLAGALTSKGVLIASGIITGRQEEAEEAICSVMNIETRRYSEDWVLLVARKESQSPAAMQQPRPESPASPD